LRRHSNRWIIAANKNSTAGVAPRTGGLDVVEKILIIEDCPPSMALIVAILSQAGYRVIQADSAERGLAIARESAPDLILMDIRLPQMDGLAATRALKADPKTHDIPVIAVTACALPGDEHLLLSAGCDGYVAKPTRYRELLAEVAGALRCRTRALAA
jgi:two-component system cell cycle response regulator DivK